jgi:hypothetical protein
VRRLTQGDGLPPGQLRKAGAVQIQVGGTPFTLLHIILIHKSTDWNRSK